MVAELERMRAEPDPVAAAAARRDEQVVDVQKFEQLIQNLQVGLAADLVTRACSWASRWGEVAAGS